MTGRLRMSIPAKITLATLLVTLMVVAVAAITSLYRPNPGPLAEISTPSPSLSPTPTSLTSTDANPFSASVVNPFEDEEYNNPFTAEYVNPFANL